MKFIHLILIILGLTLTASRARAHAFLDHALPRVGSTIAAAPTQVRIWFTEELEGAFSKIAVLDGTGREIDLKDSKIDPADKTIMTVSLPRLGPGDYRVKWSAVAVDTHHTTGTFMFTVAKP